MWQLNVKLTIGILAACIVASIGFQVVRGHALYWPAILLISGGVAAVSAVRTHFLLRKERARLLLKRELVREAGQQLVDDMARLSRADLSIFVSVLQHGERQAVCCTAQGSPNHRVFVQMADLDLMKPLGMNTVGESPAVATLARYGFTPEGYASLGGLLEMVARRRHLLTSLVAEFGSDRQER